MQFDAFLTHVAFKKLNFGLYRLYLILKYILPIYFQSLRNEAQHIGEPPSKQMAYVEEFIIISYICT
jgi:hypothetical protein